MSSNQHFVIVGGGLAGVKVAEALRANDFGGRVTLLAAEDDLPYERPPLSKQHLAGDQQLPDFTVDPPAWYRDHHVDLRLGTTVAAFDPAARTVSLPDGSTLSYDKLALATGSRPRALDLPGADASNVYTLRTIGDSDRLLEVLRSRRRLVIIGAGWIGLEVAAQARARKLEVTVLEAAELPLVSVLGPRMGTVFAELHRAHGVDLRTGVGVDLILAEDGEATGVQLDDGQVVPADAVLIAVGAQPNIEIAKAAGLATDTGILVDESLRTSDPDVVAVGDIAEALHPLLGRRVRVEHWANALNQPAVAALTMLGKPAAYDRLPYFFTDQYDLGMEYTGYVGRDDDVRVVVRGDVAKPEFVAFWLDPDNRVRAGMNVNVWDVTDRIRELVTSGEQVDPERLVDLSVDF
ncbi:NAD(P)/FAD-dependent oxidoreductase [Nocardia caishijiensis]|uniref:NAD/ferredoxin-dependent reductase-like protein n=1 Tax=Nocardia caishijiensis TaxID=184756 RepID=A0ABQ6YJE9_9NOCA|nr:FAD-dependent oxidoreductase [Nocardia caishijiensis]KAF0845905.1 NAD/ferredoxin-dependent reductase-like protein [Nocardia caishijiensis]